MIKSFHAASTTLRSKPYHIVATDSSNISPDLYGQEPYSQLAPKRQDRDSVQNMSGATVYRGASSAEM